MPLKFRFPRQNTFEVKCTVIIFKTSSAWSKTFPRLNNNTKQIFESNLFLILECNTNKMSNPKNPMLIVVTDLKEKIIRQSLFIFFIVFPLLDERCSLVFFCTYSNMYCMLNFEFLFFVFIILFSLYLLENTY